MPTCKRCRYVLLGETHACPPQFRVWNPDQGETLESDAHVIYANDATTAAEMWAKADDNDSAEYNIVKGTPAVINIQRFNTDDEPEGAVEKYRVEGYYDPVYLAEPTQ